VVSCVSLACLLVGLFFEVRRLIRDCVIGITMFLQRDLQRRLISLGTRLWMLR
jgi:hypothetical protein